MGARQDKFSDRKAGEKKKEEEKPWHGKRCSRCDAPIRYNYKADIEGWCGKCTDEIRKKFYEDFERRGTGGEPEVVVKKVRSGKVRWFLLGIVLSFLGTLAVNLFAAAQWNRLLTWIRGLWGG
jgi:hypothetical protein